MVLDALAKASNTAFSPIRYGDIAQLKHKGRTLILLKPSTYMNLSGNAVGYWLQKEKIPVENLLVIVDDLALPLGKIRLRSKGSDGGHNGLKSIDQRIGHQNYSRLRIGIGNEFPRGTQVDYVLGEWSTEELNLLSPRLLLINDLILSFSTIGIERTMNFFNNK